MNKKGSPNICSLGNQNHGEQHIPVPHVSTGRAALISRRSVLLLMTTLAISFLVILAAGLSDLRFAPAQPLNFGEGEIRPIQQTLAEIARAFSETPFWQQIALVVIFVSVTVLAIIFMPAELRKRMLRSLFRMTLLAIAILYFFNNFQLDENMTMPEELAAPMAEMEPSEATVLEPEVFEPKDVAPVWSYLISLTILGASGIGMWFVWRAWMRSQQREEFPIREFSRIARASLDDLADGAEWEDVIVRSYVQMGEVVNERRGIQREDEMTPHEFAQHLVAAGLPADPVQRLTGLFEYVRYSPHRPGKDEMAEAVACLNEIASAFGEKLR
ncbi:MAG: DUF4129 domain-containing protein [Anaerolineae bacterium]|jgi:hypothetical protein|nr:DUF4129 domain-containing protein [Anaerolineae bacterium]MBT7071064.1 DUF4129 domain-containing protein [Anaerolineae bacterium]MBT7323770.1 DUF4129 domain-containing protein [Anaerolineae bacterium]